MRLFGIERKLAETFWFDPAGVGSIVCGSVPIFDSGDKLSSMGQMLHRESPSFTWSLPDYKPAPDRHPGVYFSANLWNRAGFFDSGPWESHQLPGQLVALFKITRGIEGDDSAIMKLILDEVRQVETVCLVVEKSGVLV